MNVELLELAAADLDDLLADVMFVGGATIGLWITDPGAPPVRPTKDVDVVVEVTTRLAFHAFEDKLRARGFREDQEDGVICRWHHRESGLILDAMPARADILGFENRWQAEALPHAIELELPSGATIRAIPPAYLLATKLEAFKGRGRGDFCSRPPGSSTGSRPPCAPTRQASSARMTSSCPRCEASPTKGSSHDGESAK